MKKLFIHSFIALLVFSTLFLGCAKDNVIANTQEVLSKDDDPQRDAKDKILRFVAKIKESKSLVSNRDGTDSLTIEETVWGVESILGVYYTQVGDKFDELDSYETTLSIPITNGKVVEANIYSTYENFWNIMNSHLQSLNWSNKKLKYFDLKIDTIIGNNAIVKVESKVGRKVQSVLGDPPYFDVMEDIQAGEDGDVPNAVINCDTEETASGLLKDALNTHYRDDNPIQPANAWVVGWVDVDEYAIWENPVSNEYNEDNIRDFKIWRVNSWWPNFLEGFCISWEDMNWYYDNFVEEINGEFVDNKQFIEVKTIWAHGTWNDQIGGAYYHYVRTYVIGVPIIAWLTPGDDWGNGDLDEALDEVEFTLTP